VIDALWCLGLFLGIGAFGAAATRLVLGDRARPAAECAALSLALGLGGLGVVLFWLSLAGLRPSRAVLVAISGIALATLALRGAPRLAPRSPRRGTPALRWAGAAALALALAALALVSANALVQAMYSWDAFAIWGLKSRVVFAESLRATSFFGDPSAAFNNVSYPLLLPFQYAAVYASIGRVDAVLAKLVSIWSHAALLGLAGSCLCWRLERAPAMALVALFALTPSLMTLANSGYADATVTLFHLGNLHYLVRFEAARDRRDLALAAAFAVFLAFSKNEGLALAVLNGAVMAGFCLGRGPRGRDWRAAATYFAALFLLSAPYLLTQMSFSEVGVYLGRLPTVLAGFASQLANVANWGALWALLVAAAVVGRRAWSERAVHFLWIALALQLSLYAFVLTVTPFGSEFLIATALQRLILHLTPTALLLIALHWAGSGSGQSARPSAANVNSFTPAPSETVN
jgi:hypothetical protein